MLQKDKIIIMTRLAVYDKYDGKADKKANEYYRHDYVYRKNIWIRVCAAFGTVILLSFYWLNEIFVKGVELSSLDIQKELTSTGIFMLFILALYTIIGMRLGHKEYDLSQARLRKYYYWLNQLDHLVQRDNGYSEEDIDGTDVVFTRNSK